MGARILTGAVAGCTVAAALGTATLATGRSAAPAAAAQEVEKGALFALLTGRKEVDTEGEKGAGDPDGRGSFTAIVDGGQLCYAITVKNIATPAAAHIHRGSPDVAGDVVFPLDVPAAGDPGVVGDCTPIAADLAARIMKNPHRYYVNVHTPDFGGGAVRGQLLRRPR
jgi:hypothetical protein